MKNFITFILFMSVFMALNAQQTPFDCDGSAYLVSATNRQIPSSITVVDGQTALPTGQTIQPSEDFIYNGIGYNINNNLIYMLAENTVIGVNNPNINKADVVTMDANGVITNLGQPIRNTLDTSVIMPTWQILNQAAAGEACINSAAGVVDTQGNYFFYGVIKGTSEAFMIKLDLDTFTYEDFDLSDDAIGADLAFSRRDGKLYSTSGSSSGLEIVVTDINNYSQTFITPIPLNSLSLTDFGSAGGAWSDVEGNIYFYMNTPSASFEPADSGAMLFYNVSDNTIEQVSVGERYRFFDACSCFPSKVEKTITSQVPAGPGDLVTYNFRIYNGEAGDVIATFEDDLHEDLTWDINSITGDLTGAQVVLNGQLLTINNLTIPPLLANQGEPYEFSVSVLINDDSNADCISNVATLTVGSMVFTSINPADNSNQTEFCLLCYKNAVAGTSENTNVGISTLNRHVENGDEHWPKNINGALLSLDSQKKGFVISRLSTSQITSLNAVEGMLVFDTSENCFKMYDGENWFCLEQTCIDF